MAYKPTKEELAKHTFQYDKAAFDQPLVDFLQHFYTLSDDREHADSWVACFTENATMKRKSADVVGQQAINEVNIGSWEGQASRLHIVYKVFAFNPGMPTELMLYGMSKYVYDDGSTGQMPWSARLELRRSKDTIAIECYQIYAGLLKQPADE